MPLPGHRGAPAVALLGNLSLRAVTVAAVARMSLPKAEWQHALTAAAASTTLARRAGVAEPAAYAAGLLHDIGRAVQRQLAGHLLVTRDVHEVPSLTLERREHHLDHTEFGEITLQVLGFPPELVDAVASHHDELGCAHRPLAAVVCAGNHLAHAVDDPQPPSARVDLLHDALCNLGYELDDVALLVDDARAELVRQLQVVLA